MPWDFATDPDWQEQLDWIEQFCTDEVDPFATAFPASVYPRGYEIPKALKEQADAIKQKVKDRGLWGIFLDKEVGGPGFGQLKLALVTEILSRHGAAQTMFGCMAPDTGNMDILAKYGTEDQKERWLRPLRHCRHLHAFARVGFPCDEDEGDCLYHSPDAPSL